MRSHPAEEARLRPGEATPRANQRDEGARREALMRFLRRSDERVHAAEVIAALCLAADLGGENPKADKR